MNSCLSQYISKGGTRNLRGWMARNRDFARLRRMQILPVAAFLILQMPAIPLEQLDYVADLQKGVSTVNSLRHGDIHIDSLHRRDSRAKPHRIAVGFEYDLQFRDHREQIGKIKIAEMRDTENLALHR